MQVTLQATRDKMKEIQLEHFTIGHQQPLTIIAGPCQIENLEHALSTAEQIKKMCVDVGVQFIYKSSYDKANRSSITTKRGIGMDHGLQILKTVGKNLGIPTLTDIHESDQAQPVSEYVDVLQIPAFLCRQTDLLLAAGATGKPINVKKGQFLAPQDMKNVAEKIASTGNENIMLCERGYTHGYNNLVVDMRSLPIMSSTGYPVVFDATHSVQQPGGLGSKSGGDRTMVPYLARAAVATGCVSAVFIETHQDPDNAPSDGPNMIPLKDLKNLLEQLKFLHENVRRFN
jgi:2-dehydro-3-deoxyphosphooctonate aldolase (KDO 8-P synthase)